MDNVVPLTIQIIAITASLGFLLYIGRLILRGKLREEYSIVWVVGTILLILFSIWRDGLEIMAKLLGVYDAPNLIFMAAIFAVLIYLLHLSVVVSRLQANNKELAQKFSVLSEKMKRQESQVDEKSDPEKKD